MAIEEPEYTVIKKFDHFEIRKYGPVIIAETIVAADFEKAGNLAFKILAGYIFGDNKSQSKISMTAPVNQSSSTPKSEKIDMTSPVNMNKASNGYVVSFTMPKEYTLETLPLPNDKRVEIKKIPSRNIAVYSYSGSWSEDRFQEKLQEFKAELKTNLIFTEGEPILARFNSPFMIWFLRRNEIWIEVKYF